MWAPMDIPVISNPSVVGFAEASVLSPDVAADLRRRVGDTADSDPAPDQVLEDPVPLMLSAVRAATILHTDVVLPSRAASDLPPARPAHNAWTQYALATTHPATNRTKTSEVGGRRGG